MSGPIALDSRARAIWNAILFWILAEWAIQPQLDKGIGALAKAWHFGNGLSAANIGLGEFETLVIALGLT
ncbi:MAG: hypothetical protein JO263_11690, partial [Candidatus Eremiobacteraeota bacterium]|nr:hypothetical protein [Candidatus Eremiobacteraeota bacterium]